MKTQGRLVLRYGRYRCGPLPPHGIMKDRKILSVVASKLQAAHTRQDTVQIREDGAVGYNGAALLQVARIFCQYPCALRTLLVSVEPTVMYKQVLQLRQR